MQLIQEQWRLETGEEYYNGSLDNSATTSVSSDLDLWPTNSKAASTVAHDIHNMPANLNFFLQLSDFEQWCDRTSSSLIFLLKCMNYTYTNFWATSQFLFDVNQSMHEEEMCQEWFSHFCPRWLWSLTIWPQSIPPVTCGGRRGKFDLHMTIVYRLPYNLYCVGGDVKHCSLTPMTIQC